MATSTVGHLLLWSFPVVFHGAYGRKELERKLNRDVKISSKLTAKLVPV
jgi:hypothetical protein